MVSGQTAAFFVRRDQALSATRQFNGCPIGTVNCILFETPTTTPTVSVDDIVIGVSGGQLDDSGLVLVNGANEDLVNGEEERRRRAARGAAR